MNVEEVTHRVLMQSGLTAVGLGIARAGEPATTFVAGMRRRKGGTAVTANDKWHIGSIGKSLTAILVASLLEGDYPTFDCTLPNILPHINMHESWGECTVYHLLTSSSGLPRDFPLHKILRIHEEDPHKLRQIRRKLIEKALEKSPRAKSGTKFEYSNLGYTILGYIAECLAEKPFQDLIYDRVITPLGLSNTGFGAPKGMAEDDQPMGHRVLFGYRKTVNPFKGVSDLPTVIAPAGRLHMSLGDLLKYGSVHLAGEKSTNPLLKHETWKLLHTPYVDNYACGWVCQHEEWAAGRVIWHNGSNGMWYSHLFLFPERDFVIAIVTNDGAIKVAAEAFPAAAKEIIEAM